MTTVVRRANPGDADFLARVMLSASRGHLPLGVWDLIIGARDEGCLDYLRRLAVMEPRSVFHYEGFLVADVDGQAAAALCCFEVRAGLWEIAAEAMSRVQRDLGWTEADVAASHERRAPAWACFLPYSGADWQIENVATRPDMRSLGLAATLVERALQEGRERGRRLAQITLFIGNRAAQSVYERCGFRWSDEQRCRELEALLGSPGFLRLLRRL